MAPPPRPLCRTPQGAPWSSENENGVDFEDGDEGGVEDGDDEDGSALTVILFNLAR